MCVHVSRHPDGRGTGITAVLTRDDQVEQDTSTREPLWVGDGQRFPEHTAANGVERLHPSGIKLVRDVAMLSPHLEVERRPLKAQRLLSEK